MSYEGFIKNIKNRELKKVYLCYGTEGYLRDWILKELKKNLIDEAFETLNFVYYDGKEIDFDTIVNACETLPFMSDIKIVVVEDSPLVTSGKAGNQDEESMLNKYLPTLSESTCLVFIVNEEKVDKRKKIIKTIMKTGELIQINKINDRDLIKWVEKTFRKNKKMISKGDINYFVQTIGYSEYNNEKTLYDLENEIMKLSNYIGDRESISKDDIDRNITKSLENNIFKLLDSIGKKNPSIALKVLNEMIIGNEPIQKIIFMIIRQIRLLYMSKILTEKGYNQGDIAKKMGVHSYSAQKVIQQSRSFTSEELERALKKCLKVDESIKKGLIDNKLAVETLIIEFAQ